MIEKTDYDVIIIGGGPAGAQTALYTVRAGLDTLVIHNGASALLKAERIDNFYGVSASGTDIYFRGLEHIITLGASVVEAEVTGASGDGETFTVAAGDAEYRAEKLVIATGATRKTPKIPGLVEFEGKGVSYCAVCDAFFYRKKRVAVIGAGEYAAHEYAVLSRSAGEVILLTNGEKPTSKIENAIDKKIVEVFDNGAGRLGGVRFDDGSDLRLDGLFVALGVMGGAALGKTLGAVIDGSGAIKVDGNGRTNVEGLYAAGDCTAGMKQIAKAAFDGMTAATDIIKSFQQRER